MSDEPKFCKDCKHFRKEESGFLCTKHTRFEIITGNPLYKSADYARSFGQPCGEEANEFEAKRPRWWEFWK